MKTIRITYKEAQKLWRRFSPFPERKMINHQQEGELVLFETGAKLVKNNLRSRSEYFLFGYSSVDLDPIMNFLGKKNIQEQHTLF
jgi:hypothetical protein